MSDSAPSIVFWLDRLRTGDPAARNELIRHSRDRLRLLTRQMLRGFPGVQRWEDTSDVLQNVLVRLDRALQALEIASQRDFLRLATAQIRRELIDLARHHSGPQGLGANLVPPGHVEPGSNPHEVADSSADPVQLARWQELHTQIASLEDEDRELFELLYYQGLKQADAASVLGVPLTTFKRRWRGARVRLMMRLDGELPF
jgi:RNA polymerase sigma-70 factor (ECF subfamily)